MVRKRLLDLALLAPTAPLWAAVTAVCGAAVFLCDGPPIFFVQERVGRGGRRFWVWKLRTMTGEPDVRDRTATPLGVFLRARGLDEVPQLWNVVRGDMSLVGPRPLIPSDCERLAAAYPEFERRHAVAPGITGLVQISGATGAEYTSRLDALYARTWSVPRDIAILARTVWINVVGKRRGALRPLVPSS